MCTLLLRCAGPMQSWGTRSRFAYRDTESEPSKSGVLGLLAAALGRPRAADLSDLAALAMAVRIDAPGHVEVDYQTVLDVARADGSGASTVLSWRYYLADASFLVALTGEADLLVEAHRALRAPRWPLFLGRKGYVPGLPVYVRGGLVEETSPVEALRRVAWPTRDGEPLPTLEGVVECQEDEVGDARLDVPVSFEIGRRRYAERRVMRMVLSPQEAPA